MDPNHYTHRDGAVNQSGGLGERRTSAMAARTINVPSVARLPATNNNEEEESEADFMADVLRRRSEVARDELAIEHGRITSATSSFRIERELKKKAAGGSSRGVVAALPGAHHMTPDGRSFRNEAAWKEDVMEKGTILAPEGETAELRNSSHHRRASNSSNPGAFRVSPGVAQPRELRQEARGVEVEALPKTGYRLGRSSDTEDTRGTEEISDYTTSLRDLAVASPVPEGDNGLDQPSEHLPGADRLNLHEWRQRRAMYRKETRVRVCGGLTLGFFLIAAIVVAAVLFALSRSKEEILIGYAVPTPAPTVDPFRDHVLSLLPDFTLKAISADHATPQSWALDWLVKDPNLEEYNDEQIVQRFAMASFYYSTNGHHSDWLNDTFWLSYDHHECEWLLKPQDPVVDRLFGYKYKMDEYLEDDGPCHENKTLKHIWLYGNGLMGSLPPELSLLQNLQSIDFAYNDLAGPIPSELARLTHLEVLWLHANADLAGTLPTEIGLMTRLVDYSAIDTSLTGTLPTEIGLLSSSLEIFMQDNAVLVGTIPTEVGLLSNLRVLYLNDNLFTGTIPTELGKLTAMLDFGLEVNVLVGTLPSELAALSNVGFFFLQENQLTGTIPTELGLLTGALYVSIWGNSLRGTIPTELGQLSTLTRYLYLDMNQLTGTIPTELGRLAAAQSITAYQNMLTGTLPSEFGQLKELYGLYFYENDLTGTIPSEWKFSDAFLDLRINNNRINGTLPKEMMLWGNLRTLLLQNNEFTGTIPEELGLLVEISMLKTVDFGNNHFSGTVPEEFCALDSSIEGVWCTIMMLECPSYIGFDCTAGSDTSSSGLCGCDCECS